MPVLTVVWDGQLPEVQQVLLNSKIVLFENLNSKIKCCLYTIKLPWYDIIILHKNSIIYPVCLCWLNINLETKFLQCYFTLIFHHASTIAAHVLWFERHPALVLWQLQSVQNAAVTPLLRPPAASC